MRRLNARPASIVPLELVATLCSQPGVRNPADGHSVRMDSENHATDELYPIAGNSSLTTGSGYAEIAYARPREYFASINLDF